MAKLLGWNVDKIYFYPYGGYTKFNDDLNKPKKEELLNEARVDLLNKQIERKSLEKLKENKFNLHKKKEELKEQATNDEFGMYSFLRHKSENA